MILFAMFLKVLEKRHFSISVDMRWGVFFGFFLNKKVFDV